MSEPETDDDAQKIKDLKFETVRSLIDALRKYGIRLMYNSFTQREMIEDRGVLTAMDNAQRATIILILKQEDVKLTGPLLDAAIMHAAREDAYHPVLDYLDSLKWDGVPRLDKWLVTYLGAENSKFVTTVGPMVLIAAVRRVRRPGCKFDECLTLVSPEGAGKSESIAALVPNPEWYSCSLLLGLPPKETMENTEGSWIVESAELVGAARVNVNEVKTFLSRHKDGPARLAFARSSSERLRQFVVIATTNECAFLQSMTGDRRFWPVTITRGFPDKIAADRDQLWAEACLHEEAGWSIRLPQQLWEVAAKHQEEFRNEDPWEEKLVNSKSPAILSELWDRLGINIKDQTPDKAKRIANVMRKLKWRKERTVLNGVRTTVYRQLTPFDEESFNYYDTYKEVERPPECCGEEEAEDQMDQYLEYLSAEQGD